MNTAPRSDERQLLQPDYGGFNPRFLGISFLYDSPRRYNGVYAYLTGEPVPESEPHAIEGLDAIVLRSVIDHEARHYHDFLLSPYSSGVYRMRLMALANGLQALRITQGLDGDVIPVPLSRWATLDPDERRDLAQEWSDVLGASATVVSVPRWTEDDMIAPLLPAVRSVAHLAESEQFELYVEAAVRAYTQIDRLTQGFVESTERYLRPAYVHEASALTVQAVAVYRAQGVEETLEFLSFLLDSSLPQAVSWQRHLQVASLLERLHSGNTDPLAGMRRILTITVWAMLGDYWHDARAACPVGRFVALTSRLVDDASNTRWSCDIDDAEDLARMWDFWDTELGATSWRAALAENVASGQRGLERYEQAATTWEGPGDLPDLIRFGLATVVSEQQRIIRAFLEDPRVLAVPERYVDREEDLLPRADVRIEYRGFGVTRTRVTSGREITRKLRDGTDIVTGVAFPAMLHDEAKLRDLDKKLLLEDLLELCDFGFSRLSVPDYAVNSARAILRDVTGKRAMQIV